MLRVLSCLIMAFRVAPRFLFSLVSLRFAMSKARVYTNIRVTGLLKSTHRPLNILGLRILKQCS